MSVLKGLLVVSSGYWVDDGRLSCGKPGLIMSATDEKAFEDRGRDLAM